MLTSPDDFVAQLNGHAATAAMLAPLAFSGFAHFTAMQVRGGLIRGLDLHLERLRFASQRLFGRALAMIGSAPFFVPRSKPDRRISRSPPRSIRPRANSRTSRPMRSRWC